MEFFNFKLKFNSFEDFIKSQSLYYNGMRIVGKHPIYCTVSITSKLECFIKNVYVEPIHVTICKN